MSGTATAREKTGNGVDIRMESNQVRITGPNVGAIEGALRNLHNQSGAASPAPTEATGQKKRRHLSKEHREKIAAARRKAVAPKVKTAAG